MVNIKVAVRIRPLSRRESLLGEDVIVRKENKSVLVTNPKIPERQDGDSRQRTRRFAVDFCYDPADPEGCSQEAVYKEIGSEVLDSMFEGYNACVLAYGHSASGKTYTIMGIQGDPGLTPRLCRGLFEKLDERHLSKRIRVQIIVSFLEIYNEKVRDLLGSEETVANGSNFSLRVREHPKLGPYVQGLSEHLVTDKKKLLDLLTTGNKRRSTAATENNTHSSRSHAVFTIQFKQCDGENFETEKASKVHLVDLAGSLQEVSQQETQNDERASSAQSKERLKEGANINKSLVTLGNVVSALAESCESGSLLKAQSSSKSWHPFVPYRDSVLTWLLKDTLGGNSNTIMIATVSPASSCLGETVNTLRYAKRTKRIVNQPVVNEDPKIRTIRQLRQEIARLKRLLLSYRSCGSWSEVEETNLEETMLFSTPESKWLDPGGTKITNKEVYWNENEKKLKSFTEDEDEDAHGIKYYADDEERKKLEDIGSSSANDCEGGVLEQGAALSEGNACKINDEKKADVNGSVNDNFSHGTQIFSDSLESFSSVLQKSGNACEAARDGSGRLGAVENARKILETSTEKLNPSFLRDLSSYENFSKKQVSGMLHRSRPDLIKGISSRSKEGPPSGSSQSCTDVSNLSQSTSENSLNSSGSVDISPLEKRQSQSQDRGGKNLISRRAGANREENGAKKKGRGNEDSQSSPKKTEKRSEIVEAVTSRLYVTKKKPDRREMVAMKQQVEEEGEPEELKLCKRARMKLFDLSRKLAMSRKLKKTVDNDTQTDNMTATLRVKEKCVTTDPRGVSGVEEIGTPEKNFKEEKPCVIMNQVFIPRASNYMVECGKVVRIGAPEAAGKHESATQTAPEDGSCRNANTSPIEFNFRDEDCFSEDSLDLEDKSRHCEQMVAEQQKKVNPEEKVNFSWPPDSEIYFSCGSEKCFREKSKAEREKSKENLFNEWPLIFFSKETIFQGEDTSTLLSDACENSSEEWRKEENISSENSFTSIDGTDVSCSSETSSEDFVFYESSKDKDLAPLAKLGGDRELYTITENSEQSDPSGVFSPVQSHVSSLSAPHKSEANEHNKSEPENARNHRQVGKVQKETKMRDRAMDVKGAKIRDEFVESKHACEENKTERKDSDKIFTTFMEASHSNKIKSENLKVPKPILFFTAGTTSKGPDRVPRFAERRADSGTENKTEIKYSHPEGFRCRLRGTKTDSRPISWTDFQLNSEKQYLNLNISSSNISKPPAFSVDTHLFGKASRKNQSADAMFNSADSITFVFMGPAKPKTSVLMEIIRRSLGKSCTSSDESRFAQRKSRSRGVQCDANLMRSVSIDSAMIALSRIAKNQEPCSDLRRAASLRALSPNDTPAVLSRVEINSQWDLKAGNSEKEQKKSALKYSVAASTNPAEKMKNKKTEEAEKVKKSVSWSGEARHEVELAWEASEIGQNCRDPPEPEAEDSNEGNQRRVRFSKRETPEQATEPVGSVDPLKAFLKEATQLLKYINFRSSKYPEFSCETVEGFAVEKNQMAGEKHWTDGLNNSKNPEKKQNATENCINLEKDAIWRPSTGTPGSELRAGNLTWPRMRPAAGKPPTGMKPKFPTSLLSSRSDSLHLNGFSDSTRNFSRSDRTVSSVQSWNLSNPSVAPRENQSGLPGSRASCCNESFKRGWITDSYSSPRAAFSRPNIPALNFDSISELETDLEESCRRLEIAAERDRMRESMSNGLKAGFEWFRNEMGPCFRPGATEDEFRGGKTEARDIIKRRKPEKCADTCTCRASRVDPCKYLWSKDCHSSFELDSFGPGSSHCHQLCMFCRKKDAEIYYSALSLNSKCSSDLCRLNYYGFCPCSSVRLSQVASSPRAYMQRLLTLRRRIVSQTKRELLDAKTSKAQNSDFLF